MTFFIWCIYSNTPNTLSWISKVSKQLTENKIMCFFFCFSRGLNPEPFSAESSALSSETSHLFLIVSCNIFFFLTCSLFPHTPDISWALLSTAASSLLYGRTVLLVRCLQGPICSDFSFHPYCKDALIFACWEVSKFRCIFRRFKVTSKEFSEWVCSLVHISYPEWGF